MSRDAKTIQAELDDVNGKRDALTLHARELSVELVDAEAVEKVALMTPAQKASLRAALAVDPSGIPSEEKFGRIGG